MRSKAFAVPSCVRYQPLACANPNSNPNAGGEAVQRPQAAALRPREVRRRRWQRRVGRGPQQGTPRAVGVRARIMIRLRVADHGKARFELHIVPAPTATRLPNSNPNLNPDTVSTLDLNLTSALPPSPLRNASSVRAPSASSGTNTACRSPRAKQADRQMTDSMRAIGNTCRYREARAKRVTKCAEHG